jgi:hypothetical protein
MIDHLLNAADAPTLAALLAPLGHASIDPTTQAISWGPEVLLNVGGPNNQSIQVITSAAVWDDTTSPPTLTTPATLAPGFWVIVALPALSSALQNLSGNACVLITDRDAAMADNPSFILYEGPSVTPEMLSTYTVEPTPAGSNYPFGHG